MKNNGGVLYIGSFELPDRDAAAHRVLANGKMLRKLGFEVIFFGISRHTDANLFESTQFSGFECYSFPLKKLGWRTYYYNIENYIHVIKKKNINVIICYNLPSISLLRLLLYCRRNRIKIIADCTEWYGRFGSSLLKQCVLSLDTFLRMKWIHKKMDGLIVISSYLYNYYSTSCKKPLVLIPPLVDLRDEKWDKFEKLPVKLNSSHVNISYSGNPGLYKDDISYTLRVLTKIKDSINFRFFVSGLSRLQYLEIFPSDEQLLEILGQKVVFLGRITHSQSLNLISQSSFFMFFRNNLLRSNRAGFPTKFVESVSCGTPVITNDNSDLAWYINNKSLGFIFNTEDDIIRLLKNSPTEFSQLKKQIDRSIFDISNYVDVMCCFLEQISIFDE